MRNVFKLIKYLSLALCFGLYLNLSTTSALAEVQQTDGKFYSASKGQNVSWDQLSADEKKAAASIAVMENATGKDKVEAAKRKLDEAKASGDAAAIAAAQKAYNQADANHKAALKTYNEQSSREARKHGGTSDKANQAGDAAKDAAAATAQAQSDLQAKSKALSDAYASGDQAAIDKAKSEYETAKGKLNTAKETQKEADKAAKKAIKEANKESKKIQKEENKAIKEVEKAQKKAEKDLKSAEKDIKKLEEKCAKGKCSDKDQEKLAKAHAKASNAQTALDEANSKAHALDVAQNKQDVENAYMDSREAEAASDNAEDYAEQAKKDIAEATSKAPQMCNADEIKGNIFMLIACKATTTLADLRVIAYIISGFGMVALAYAAIFGKMNWKHLANIGIGLFLLSMMTPFIEYFVYDGKKELKFGKYLPAGFTDIQGSDGKVEDCGKVNVDGKSSSLCEVLVTADVKKEKWSLKDLKGSIQAGMSAVRNASDMYKAAKSTVSNVKSQVSNMKSAIKNGGGGLDGIINGVTAVAGAAGNIVNSGQLLANNIASNASNLTNNIRDAGSTNQSREARAKHQAQMDALSKKCNAGNCSDTEKEALQKLQEVTQNEKTGFDKWMEKDGAGGGATIMAGINKVGGIADDTRNVAGAIANGTHEGQAIGGGGVLGTILGIGMGAGTGFTEGMDALEKNKQNGNLDFRSAETKREDAYKQSSDYVTNKVEDANKTVETRGDGSTKVTYKDGSTTITNKDGTSIVTKADGTTTTTDANGRKVTTYKDDPNKKVVENVDGTKTVTDSQGNQVTYDHMGNKVDVNLTQENKYKRQTAESNKEALSAKPQKTQDTTGDTTTTPPATADNTVINDTTKAKRKAECSNQPDNIKSMCEACAAKNTEGEYKTCLSELNAKIRQDKAKTTPTSKGEEKKKTADTSQEWCTQANKTTCFGASEGANQALTAKCKSCNFRMAKAESKDSVCASLKEEKERARREYQVCNSTPGKDCNPASEKAAEKARLYKERCPNG